MIVPRTASSWYSLSTEECALPPSTTTSSTAFSAAAPRQRRAQLALGDRDRDRLLAPVENARDEALPAQAAGLGGAEDGPVLDHQLDALSCHGAGV